MLTLVEISFIAAAIGLAYVAPNLGTQFFTRIEARLSRVAANRALAILIAGLVPVALRTVMLPWVPVPLPAMHDEFSYLLAADTFTHGRLTNPPHPMWTHFETFHEIFQPTYASMYPPMQGLILALGKLLGHPFVGVLLSTGIMCAAICWMLQGWMPAPWALKGALLPATNFAVFSYWNNSYWGGCPAAIGGALVLGALPRLRKHGRTLDAMFFGMGLSILANSRPYEGFVLGLISAVALTLWVFRDQAVRQTLLSGRVLIPLACVLAISAAATSFYFFQVTGSPSRMPLQVNRQAYAIAPYFFGQKANSEPEYRNAEIRNFYLNVEYPKYLETRGTRGFVIETLRKLAITWMFYVGPVLTVPLFMLPWILRDRHFRLLLFTGAISFAASAAVIFFMAHYLAAMTGVIAAIIVQGLRHLRALRWEGKQSGLFLARAVVVVCVMMMPARFWQLAAEAKAQQYDTAHARAQVLRDLVATPGQHLVFVRYQAGHDTRFEWVYNAADIDGAKVVWARDMGDIGNRELKRYFGDREVWWVGGDRLPAGLMPDQSANPAHYARDQKSAD